MGIETTNNEKKQSLGSALVDLAFFVAIILFIRADIFEPFRIPSASMRPTLIEDDHIIVSKLSYGIRIPFMAKSAYLFDTPKRGDIVVFTLPEDSGTNIIKRVIALPGETVQVKEKTVLINGKPLDESGYEVQWLDGGIADFGPFTVPEGHVYLMGDNRDHSRDSRFWDNPALDIRLIKGRAKFIYWNFHAMHRIGTVLNK